MCQAGLSEPSLQIERAVKRGMDRDDAQRRMARQMSRDERRALADYVIDNNESVGALETESMHVYDKLRRDLETKKKSAAGNPMAPHTSKS